MRKASLFLFLFAAACGDRALPPGGSDGGDGNDGSVAADLAGLSCGEIAQAVTAWLDGHTQCTADADCTIVATGCGLPEPCGAPVDQSAVGPYLSSLLDGWRAEKCEQPCGLFCPFIGRAVCVDGTCRAGGPVTPKPVGDPCTSDGECATGQCVTEAASGGFFPGGICTIRNCDSKLITACPAGSSCQVAGAPDGASYCLKDCCARCNTVQCRDGYACCGNPQMDGADAVCVPPPSLLCHQGG